MIRVLEIKGNLALVVHDDGLACSRCIFSKGHAGHNCQRPADVDSCIMIEGNAYYVHKTDEHVVQLAKRRLTGND